MIYFKHIVLNVLLLVGYSKVFAMEEGIFQGITDQATEKSEKELEDKDSSVTSKKNLRLEINESIISLSITLASIHTEPQDLFSPRTIEGVKQLINSNKTSEKSKSLEFYTPQQKVENGLKRRSIGITVDEIEGKKFCDALQKKAEKLEKKVARSKKKRTTKSLNEFNLGTIQE